LVTCVEAVLLGVLVIVHDVAMTESTITMIGNWIFKKLDNRKYNFTLPKLKNLKFLFQSQKAFHNLKNAA
jgi:hypothetical protein